MLSPEARRRRLLAMSVADIGFVDNRKAVEAWDACVRRTQECDARFESATAVRRSDLQRQFTY